MHANESISDNIIAAIIGSIAVIIAAYIAKEEPAQLSRGRRILKETILGAALGAIAGVVIFAILDTFLGLPKGVSARRALLVWSILGMCIGAVFCFISELET